MTVNCYILSENYIDAEMFAFTFHKKVYFHRKYTDNLYTVGKKVSIYFGPAGGICTCFFFLLLLFLLLFCFFVFF